jgi:hypothetical protein
MRKLRFIFAFQNFDMKKILFPVLAILALVSCEEDPVAVIPGYPTDGLVLREEQKLLFHTKTSLSATAASFAAFNLIIDEEYANRIYTTSSFSMGDALHTEFSDTISNRLGISSQGVVVNGQNALALDQDDLDVMLMKEPLLAVAHKGGQNDTAWFTDVKLKFFRDTSVFFIYVESYLMSDFKATEDTASGIDLRIPAFPDVVREENGMSVFDDDVYGFDSVLVAKNGDPVRHEDVVLLGNPHFTTRGINIAQDVNIFGTQFNEGDVLGTEFTPIRVYIKKPENLNEDFEDLIEPEFLTIVRTVTLVV